MLHNVLCSLCVVIHQRFSDLESHQISSQVAPDPVLQNPELYTVSLISVINHDIHHFILSLSNYREQTNSYVIQAAADLLK